MNYNNPAKNKTLQGSSDDLIFSIANREQQKTALQNAGREDLFFQIANRSNLQECSEEWEAHEEPVSLNQVNQTLSDLFIMILFMSFSILIVLIFILYYMTEVI